VDETETGDEAVGADDGTKRLAGRGDVAEVVAHGRFLFPCEIGFGWSVFATVMTVIPPSGRNNTANALTGRMQLMMNCGRLGKT
jgi:hypothetical protein